MPPRDLGDLRVSLCKPDREEMADKPEQEADDPKAKPKANRSGQRAIGNRDGAWRSC